MSFRLRVGLRTFITAAVLFGAVSGVVLRQQNQRVWLIRELNRSGAMVGLAHRYGKVEVLANSDQWSALCSCRVNSVVLRQNPHAHAVVSLLPRGGAIERLEIHSCHLEDDDFAVIGTLRSLRELSFHSVQLSGSQIKKISALPKLEDLSLSGCTLEDAAFPEIGKIRSLRRLSFFGSVFRDSHLRELTGLKELREINLDGSGLTDDGCILLASLENLQTLKLSHTKVTDRGVRSLDKLQNLKLLFLRETRVSSGAQAELRAILPALELMENPRGKYWVRSGDNERKWNLEIMRNDGWQNVE